MSKQSKLVCTKKLNWESRLLSLNYHPAIERAIQKNLNIIKFITVEDKVIKSNELILIFSLLSSLSLCTSV